MSKIFYDHLIKTENLERRIRLLVEMPEEREELWKIIDEIIQHEVLHLVLDRLHEDLHEEFLTRYCDMPHSEDNLLFLKEKVAEDVEDLLGNHIGNLLVDFEKQLE